MEQPRATAEKRRKQRFRLALPIHFSAVSRDSGIRGQGNVVDISGGGVAFRSETRIPAGVCLRASIAWPAGPNEGSPLQAARRAGGPRGGRAGGDRHRALRVSRPVKDGERRDRACHPRAGLSRLHTLGRRDRTHGLDDPATAGKRPCDEVLAGRAGGTGGRRGRGMERDAGRGSANRPPGGWKASPPRPARSNGACAACRRARGSFRTRRERNPGPAGSAGESARGGRPAAAPPAALVGGLPNWWRISCWSRASTCGSSRRTCWRSSTTPAARDPIHAIFRAFHTIKGIAGFLELQEIRELSHETETLLDEARNGRLEPGPAGDRHHPGERRFPGARRSSASRSGGGPRRSERARC